jgi:hypothetical protein
MKNLILFLALLVGAATASFGEGPTFDVSQNTSTCNELHDNRGTKSHWGESSFPLIYLGVTTSMDACSDAATGWRNATEPDQRCRSTCWWPRPKNTSYLNQCYCRVTPLWMPLPSLMADSAVANWPCTGPADCSYNGVCAASAEDSTAGAGGCKCAAAWGGVRCGELQLLPVPRETPGFRETNASDGSNISTWGAPVLYDNVSKQWHGWASEMMYGCGINAWETNSRIVHIVSDAPSGPFTRKEVSSASTSAASTLISHQLTPLHHLSPSPLSITSLHHLSPSPLSISPLHHLYFCLADRGLRPPPKVFAPPFAHEPDVVRGPDGEWVMLYSAFNSESAKVGRRSVR